MEIINILLIGRDMDYCKALCECISQLSKDILITLYSIENDENSGKGDFHLLLKEGEKESEILKNEGNKKTRIFLVENRQEVCNDLENKIFCLYKYENVKELIKEIQLIFNLISGKNVSRLRNHESRILSIYSGCGGIGKTSVALGLAQEFARFRGKKTLYINYEEWDETGDYVDFQNKISFNSIGNYLYYLNQEREIDLSTFLQEDEYGVLYFQPNPGRNQLKGLQNEELCFFIDQLTEREKVDYIIFDCHNSLDDGTLWLLNNSNRIIYLLKGIPQSPGSTMFLKDDKIIEYIGCQLNRSIEEKLVRVSNLNDEMEICYESNGLIRIEVDSNSFQVRNGVVKISIERGFGQGIKSIADRIEDG